VITSHALASRAAEQVLADGGNAVDAVAAAALAQTVVEPHMASLCGVFSMLHLDAATGSATYLNGSMNAPLAPLDAFTPKDVSTARGVTVPGFVAGLEAALDRFGSKPRTQIYAAAVQLAREGFEITPFLYGYAFKNIAGLGRYADGRDIFFRDGRLVEPGEVLRQPALADTLSALSEAGSDYFYRSDFTKRFIERLASEGGVLTLEDFSRYEVRWMTPARSTYRDMEVLGSPPPDNGGTHIIEILNMVEQLPIEEWGPAFEHPETAYWLLRLCGEVYLSGADQGDPFRVPVPLDLITSKDYASMRLDLMKSSLPLAPTAQPSPGSNHITVVDAQGNIATVLHSLMSTIGTTGLFVDGVQVWGGGGHLLRRMPHPGDRATCYVAPMLLLKNGRPVLAAGSPSISLLQNLVQNITNIVDFGMDVETSVHHPRFGATGASTRLDTGLGYLWEADLNSRSRELAESRGIAIEVVSPWHYDLGSFEGIVFGPSGSATACADPRRLGVALAV
jgi:gamma-glutamyltranspeptidase/glutathione hydrolase